MCDRGLFSGLLLLNGNASIKPTEKKSWAVSKSPTINQTITYGDYERFSVEAGKEKLKDPSQSDKTQKQ
jgi:hypothetical protein